MKVTIELELKKETIYVYQYSSYRGGYAIAKELMWRCSLVGANDWMDKGIGYRNKCSAVADAARWAEFLGWPVVDIGRCEAFDDHPEK